MTDHSYPTTKTIEGWFQYANDAEYGPTLIRYIGSPSIPIRSARTKCEYLDDNKWEEVVLTPEGNEWYHNKKAVYMKITVEMIKEKELLEKRG